MVLAEAESVRPPVLAVGLTGDGARLVDAAERTFTETLAELIGSTLEDSEVAAAAQALARLRGVLEQNQVGMPTG